jgi:hypothetical protein
MPFLVTLAVHSAVTLLGVGGIRLIGRARLYVGVGVAP